MSRQWQRKVKLEKFGTEQNSAKNIPEHSRTEKRRNEKKREEKKREEKKRTDHDLTD